jgi:hypothetical protein
MFSFLNMYVFTRKKQLNFFGNISYIVFRNIIYSGLDNLLKRGEKLSNTIWLRNRVKGNNHVSDKMCANEDIAKQVRCCSLLRYFIDEYVNPLFKVSIQRTSALR